jgi:hypothetical protein
MTSSQANLGKISPSTRMFLRILYKLHESSRELTSKRCEGYLHRDYFSEDLSEPEYITRASYNLLSEDEKSEYGPISELMEDYDDEKRVAVIVKTLARMPTLDKKDHQNLMRLLGYRETNLCYLAVIQLLKLLNLNFIARPNGPLMKIITGLMADGSRISVKRSITELRVVPHLYLWPIVCSPNELSVIFPSNATGGDIFKKFNLASKLFKNRDSKADKIFTDITQTVEKLPSGVKAVVYTRLKRYKNFRDNNPELFTKSTRTNMPIHWKYNDYLYHMLKNNEVTLITEEGLLACAAGKCTSVAQTRCFTDHVKVSEDKRTYSYYSEVRNIQIYKELALIKGEDMSPCETALMVSINARAPNERR